MAFRAGSQAATAHRRVIISATHNGLFIISLQEHSRWSGRNDTTLSTPKRNHTSLFSYTPHLLTISYPRPRDRRSLFIFSKQTFPCQPKEVEFKRNTRTVERILLREISDRRFEIVPWLKSVIRSTVMDFSCTPPRPSFLSRASFLLSSYSRRNLALPSGNEDAAPRKQRPLLSSAGEQNRLMYSISPANPVLRISNLIIIVCTMYHRVPYNLIWRGRGGFNREVADTVCGAVVDSASLPEK